MARLAYPDRASFPFMTSAEVQTQLNDAACLSCLTSFQLRQVQAALLWQQLNPGVPMTAADVEATLSDASCLGCRTQFQIELIIAELLWEINQGGGGSGDVASGGTNYCFSGAAPNQVLKIKNTTTGLANRVDMSGADGAQGLDYSDGSAC